MTDKLMSFELSNLDTLLEYEGELAILLDPNSSLNQAARRLNRLTKGAVLRAFESKEFKDLSECGSITLSFPSNIKANSITLIKLERRAKEIAARKAGAEAVKATSGEKVVLIAGNHVRPEEVAYGFALRNYKFTQHKTDKDSQKPLKTCKVICVNPDEALDKYAPLSALVMGAHFTRDLVNEPANILSTSEFADRIKDLSSLGLKITIFEEKQLIALGMNAFVAVGIGSETPTKMAVMEWNGGGDEAPLALVGKGVVFDTGGISIKPSAGMEDMTMDMGGAGVVCGVMRAIALRKAKANVVGLVGLVENMPDGKAQRPGDIVTSMKGDTIEVINTDAEGRLVLADVLWYAQETFKPKAVIDLATLTGAVIVGLGHENAGVFSNDETLVKQFLKSATFEDEGAWRLPLSPAYGKLIKSQKADIKNVGGRAAGSITAAQFLQVFVREDMPWIHLDIAGVAQVDSETTFAPKGATGWGVRSLNHLIQTHYEG